MLEGEALRTESSQTKCKHHLEWFLCLFFVMSLCFSRSPAWHITGATKGYHCDLTLGFSHSFTSLRSTYLGCSFNFCLLHLTAIFGASFVTICCILVAGLKPAPWMFLQYMLRQFSNCFHPDQLISPGTYWSVTLKLDLGFQTVQSAFILLHKRNIYWTFRA